MRWTRSARAACALIALGALAGCNDSIGVSSGGVFVVSVSGEQFRVRIDNALLATRARRIAAGAENQKVVAGDLARGDGGFNTGYGWHITPGTVSLIDQATAECDGKPSDVQSDIDHWVDDIRRFCPAGSRIVAEVLR
jgi:hypothetical protein